MIANSAFCFCSQFYRARGRMRPPCPLPVIRLWLQSCLTLIQFICHEHSRSISMFWGWFSIKFISGWWFLTITPPLKCKFVSKFQLVCVLFIYFFKLRFHRNIEIFPLWPPSATGGDILQCVRLLFSFALGFKQTTVWYSCWSRSHLSELRRFLCHFHSAGVVFAERFSIAVQTSL